MKNKIYSFFINLVFIIVAFSFETYATHLRGGEITLKRKSENALTYLITITTYTDAIGGLGANNNQNKLDNNGLKIYNNGVLVAQMEPQRVDRRSLNRETEKNVYTIEYTFRANGTYLIGANIRNRNEDVVNMKESVQTSFYIETLVIINSELGLNGTPLLLNPAVDFTAAIGQKFIHNSNAYDAEGDSLAYRLIIPRQIPDNSETPKLVNDYRDPTQAPAGGKNELGNGPSTFKIDSLTGDLIWDAPAAKGQYNVAFEILEYRNGILISITVRDMQIIVKEGKNNRPLLEIPDEICIQAGEKVNLIIKAVDKDDHPIVITSFGPVYKNVDPPLNGVPPTQYINAPWATFISSITPKTNATGTFEWQTSCDHIRAKAYEVLFKAEDTPAAGDPKLTDTKTWRIRIVAPSVLGLVAKPKGSGAVELNWTKYNCALPGAEILIYRKVGCTPFEPNTCFGGIPLNLGYTLLGSVPVENTSYVDKGLSNNIFYSYRLVVKFAEATGGGEGIVSKEVCVSVPLQMPIITNVSIEKTSKTEGEVFVKWTRPLGFLPDEAVGPYQYRINRAQGNSTVFTLIKTIDTNISTTNPDTSFTDIGLNTTDQVYKYNVELWYTKNGTFTLLDGTLPAATVRLSATPADKSIALKWEANVPWNNDNQVHVVYRETTPGVFNIIAEVLVKDPNTYTYVDNGQDTYAADGTNNLQLSSEATYCYKVLTVGAYANIAAVSGLLLNNSQIICGSPKNFTKPCPPVLKVNELNCEDLKEISCKAINFENILSWTVSQSANCDTTYRGFNIYFARYEGDPLIKVASISDGSLRQFSHAGLSSFAGCYYITAVNKYGNESDPSNRICKDNCPDFLQFPNVITPNNDGLNDDFQPMWCGLFVKSIIYTVVNRNGAKVFQSQSADPLIKWPGVNNEGVELPVGVYYYEAEVTFDRLVKNPPKQKVKGWVEIIR
ncbi:MAG: gliding motility-associated C-terminal domain-containing protein [Bacteroidota bacterium]